MLFVLAAGFFFFFSKVAKQFLAHPVSYSVGTSGSSPGGEVARSWSWPFIFI